MTDGGKVRGVISLRDVNNWLTRELKQVNAALMAVKRAGVANLGRSPMASSQGRFAPHGNVGEGPNHSGLRKGH